MAEYGLTASGINIKRLDVIIDEIHSDLTRDNHGSREQVYADGHRRGPRGYP